MSVVHSLSKAFQWPALEAALTQLVPQNQARFPFSSIALSFYLHSKGEVPFC
jgi:hypothetical protein